MTRKQDRSVTKAELRRRAEEVNRGSAPHPPENLESLSADEIRRIFHELQVHQIELEMQNEELSRAQVELDATRARYFDLYDMAPVGYCTISENGLIQEANLKAASILGVARGALVRERLSRFIFTEDEDIYYRLRKQLLESSTPQSCELRMVQSDRTVFWAHLSATLVKGKSGKPVSLMTLTDVTERKQAENELRERDKRLHFVLENCHIGSWEFNLTNNTATMSPEHGYIFGYTDITSQWSLDKFLNHVLPEDRPMVEKITQQGIATQSGWSFECRIRRKDGTTRWIAVNGRCQNEEMSGTRMVVGIVQDISRRKFAEKQLLNAHGEMERKVLERTADLEKTDATLAMMLDYARITEIDIQERVVSNLRSNILGIVDLVKKEKLTKNTMDLINLLESTSRNMAHPLARNLESKLLQLTTREIQLASFIQLGKSTKEIMALLNVTAKTVEAHRTNLRKKLGINRKKINLRSFLNSEFSR